MPEIEERVPEAVIRRLPRYYRYLREKMRLGEVRVSSSQMSADMGLNASQIRRDLNIFGGFGQQGYGYSVERLLAEIEAILGLNQEHTVVVVGAGHIGTALSGYQNFDKQGFRIVGMFDVDEARIGSTINGIEVMHMDGLQKFTSENAVDIAMLCTPKEAAQKAASTVESAGIRAIWNFAPIDIVVADDVAVESLRLNDSLYVLSYRMNRGE